MVGNLSPFLCLLWPACWLEGCQLGLRGSPKGSKKGPQNDPKSIRNPPGQALACLRVSGGTPQVPPRLPTCIKTCIFMHIYAYFAHIHAYLCIFCTYLCMFSLVLCILYISPIFIHIMYIYANSNILVNVYGFLMHICTHLCSL